MPSTSLQPSLEGFEHAGWVQPTPGFRLWHTAPGPVDQVQIFGQRCSGTNVLRKLVSANFGAEAITDFYGFKHWFVPEQILFPANVLIMVVARDPFDWIRSLHRQPWHAHPDLKTLAFSQFLRAEWHSYWDAEFGGIEPRHPLFGREMLHERDPATRLRFANALRKRAAKLRSWSELTTRCNHLALLDQAVLASTPHVVLDALAQALGRAHPADLTALQSYKGNGLTPFQPRRYDPLTPEDVDFVRSQLDPDVEHLFGYDIARPV